MSSIRSTYIPVNSTRLRTGTTERALSGLTWPGFIRAPNTASAIFTITSTSEVCATGDTISPVYVGEIISLLSADVASTESQMPLASPLQTLIIMIMDNHANFTSSFTEE
jgi:hypothetical protein